MQTLNKPIFKKYQSYYPKIFNFTEDILNKKVHAETVQRQVRILQTQEFHLFLKDIKNTKMSNKLKEFYFKVASLCKLKKTTPIVTNLNTGTDDEPHILSTDA